MKLPKKTVNDLKANKEWGDVDLLMKRTGIKSRSHMHNIINGTASTTVGRVGKIVMFINERKKTIKNLTK